MADVSIPTGAPFEGHPTTLTVTTFAQTVLDDADAATLRTTIGAGTSSVALPIATADVTGLDTALSGKQPLDSDLTTIAANITAAGHALLDDVDAAAQRTTLGLGSVDNTADSAKPVSTAQQAALDLKANAANPVFTGTVTIPDGALAIADTSGLQTALDGKQASDTQLTSLAALAYAANALKVVRVNAGETDFELATPSAGAAWGGITGTLSAQTDLQSVLDAKQATLVSQTNIKSINGTTLLGSGDLTVSAGDPSYSPGSFTVATETQRFAPHRLQMTTNQRITVEGTGRLSCLN